jgi:hypothetical protein
MRCMLSLLLLLLGWGLPGAILYPPAGALQGEIRAYRCVRLHLRGPVTA